MTEITLVPNRPDVIDESFGAEAVLVQLRTGRYYALDPAASAVWAQLLAGEPLALQDPGVAWLVRRLVEEELATGVLPDGLLETPEPDGAPRLEVFRDMEDLLVLDPIHDIDLDGTGWPATAA